MKIYKYNLKPRFLDNIETADEWLQELEQKVNELPLNSAIELSFITTINNIDEVEQLLKDYIHEFLDRKDIKLIVKEVTSSN
jgi:hypothetical protein